MRSLVIIPTEAEVSAFLEALRESGRAVKELTEGRLRVAVVQELDMAVACGGLGKVEMGVRTQHLLDSNDWSLVSCAGAAARLDPRVQIGDVVIGTETVEHDIRKGRRDLLPRFQSDPALVGGLRAATQEMPTSFSVRFGPIASGDEDILDDLRREEVRDRTGALAVAWEGAGAARACLFSNTPFVEIRGITDNADPTGPEDFVANLASAMRNVSAIARLL